MDRQCWIEVPEGGVHLQSMGVSVRIMVEEGDKRVSVFLAPEHVRRLEDALHALSQESPVRRRFPKRRDVLLVLRHEPSPVDDFIERNLAEMELGCRFIDSTEDFARLSMLIDAKRLLVTSPEWSFMLEVDRPGRVFAVSQAECGWGPLPGEDGRYHLEGEPKDDLRFQRAVREWLDREA